MHVVSNYKISNMAVGKSDCHIKRRRVDIG
jgi:hypothetical protein